MFETGVLLLFIVPGIAAYAAIYGLFHSGKTIAPEPPGANSVEAVVIIVGASVAVHAFTSLIFTLNIAVCGNICPIHVPATWLDPYVGAMRALAGQGIGGTALTFALVGGLGQGLVVYAVIRRLLGYLALNDRLPAWIYGWSTKLADSLDNENTVVVAYVLTTADVAGKTVAYGGMLNDMAMNRDGTILRITLVECERYLVDLSTALDKPSLSEALSTFSFMTIDAANIRNIAFETLVLDATDEQDQVLSS